MSALTDKFNAVFAEFSPVKSPKLDQRLAQIKLDDPDKYKDCAELILELEAQFGIRIYDDEYRQCKTVGELCRLVMSKV